MSAETQLVKAAPSKVKMVQLDHNIGANEVVEIPVQKLYPNDIPLVVDSYHNNGFLGLITPMVARIFGPKIKGLFSLDPDYDSDEEIEQLGTLSKIVEMNYKEDKLISVLVKALGKISVTSVDQHGFGEIVPISKKNSDLIQPKMSHTQTRTYVKASAQIVQTKAFFTSQDSNSNNTLASAYDIDNTDFDEDPNMSFLYPSETFNPTGAINAVSVQNKMLEHKARDRRDSQDSMSSFKQLVRSKGSEMSKLENKLNTLSVENYKDELYDELGTALAYVPASPDNFESRYMQMKALEDPITGPKLLGNSIEESKKQKLLELPSSVTTSDPVPEPMPLPAVPTLQLTLPPPPPPQTVSINSVVATNALQLSQVSPQIVDKPKYKPKQPSFSLRTLVVPISEPIFPTTSIKNLRVINPEQRRALINIATNDELFALFYIKGKNFRPYNIVTSEEDIYDCGVLAKVEEFASYKDKDTGLDTLEVNLVTYSRVKIKKLIPPDKTTPHSKCCWAEVSVDNSIFRKNTVPELRIKLRKVLKKLLKLFYKCNNKEFRAQFMDIMERNYKNLAVLEENIMLEMGVTLDRPFNFYDTSTDNAELIEMKMNIVCEILKSYYILMFKTSLSKVSLNFHLGNFQHYLEKRNLMDKLKDLLNLLEVAVFNLETIESQKLESETHNSPIVETPSTEGSKHRHISGTKGKENLLGDSDSHDPKCNRYNDFHKTSLKAEIFDRDSKKLSPENTSGTNETLLSSFSVKGNMEDSSPDGNETTASSDRNANTNGKAKSVGSRGSLGSPKANSTTMPIKNVFITNNYYMSPKNSSGYV